MYIIAIDTGSEESAYVIYNKETKQLADKNKLPNVEVIKKMKNFCATHKVELVVQEMCASYGMPVGMPVLMNCFIIGLFSQLFKQFNIPVNLIFRKTVKLELCGSIRGVTDSAVNITIQDMYCNIYSRICKYYNTRYVL